MNWRQAQDPLESNEEIQSLIEVLHGAEHRLEELTAGEVDSVASLDGRTLLLRRAQDRMRSSEAARQLAILNALPTHVALLDVNGVIVSVNAAWQRFEVIDPVFAPGHAIGRNYVAICDSAPGLAAGEARLIAAGIRSVLDGSQRIFSIEYTTHSVERRSFFLVVTSLANDQPRGAVVTQLEVTEARQAGMELRESERRFSAMLGNLQLASVMLDCAGRITYCNDYFLRLTGWGRAEVLGGDWFAIFLPDGAGDLKDTFRTLLTNPPEVWYRESQILTRSGERRLIRWNISVLRSGDGDPLGTASVGEDITERKQAEAKIIHLNRVYAMLSGINTLIVRARGREELFKDACRIAVDAGGFQVSLLGTVDDTGSAIVPIALAGKDENLLASIRDILAAGKVATAMTAQAIDTKKAVVSNDSQHDPQVAFVAEHAEFGIRSMAILPILVADRVVGVLALYSNERDFFRAEEIKLLTELTDDIAFGIDHLERGEKLNYLAYHDSITGLANRAMFHQRLECVVRDAVEQVHGFALALMNIERFKSINDTVGRSAGDALLKAVAARLSTHMGDDVRLARINSDQFAILLPDLQTEEEVSQWMETRVKHIFGPSFSIRDSELCISARFGIALFTGDGSDADTLFRNAESALKKAKVSGERLVFYAQEMNERRPERLSLEHRLRRAVDNGDFVLHYQPKLNLASGVLTGAEALIRWNDGERGVVLPGQFIPILEETGWIHQVGRWALRKASEDYLQWCSLGLCAVRIAVNVSPLQLRSRGFIAEIAGVIGGEPITAAGLELEITESLIMEDVKHTIASLHAVREMGLTIAIDDFGTGFSSLSYLSRLPVDTLKIDRSFITDMTVGSAGIVVVKTIVDLGHSLDLNVVAEGVETEQQSHILRALNCDEAQGFLFSKALPAQMFAIRYLDGPTR